MPQKVRRDPTGSAHDQEQNAQEPKDERAAERPIDRTRPAPDLDAATWQTYRPPRLPGDEPEGLGTVEATGLTGGGTTDAPRNALTGQASPARRALRALGIVFYLALFAAVIALGYAVVHHLTRPEDLALERSLQATHNPALFALMDFVSAIGYAPPTVVIVVAAVITMWVLRFRLEALFLALANVADAIGDLVKHLVERQRPSPSLVHVFTHLTTPSFPSGHAVHYAAFYGMLLVVILTCFRPSVARAAWITFLALLILLVGASRVYLGEHWPSDVIAGYAIGLLWLIPLVLAYAWMRAHPGRIPFTGWLYAGDTQPR